MPDPVSNQLGFYIDGPAVIYAGPMMCDATAYTSPTSSVSGGQLGTLVGFTDGGVTISYQTMTHRINGDEYGGSEGMPAELLILGGLASIRATLVKWDNSAIEKRIMSGANILNGDDGEIPGIGAAYFGQGYGFSFWVIGKNSGMGYLFPKCELATQAKQWNISSLERRLSLSVQAYCVYNKVTDNNVTQGYADTFFKDADTNSFVAADCVAQFP